MIFNSMYRYLINFICLFYSTNIRRKKRKELVLLPSIIKKHFKTKNNLKNFITSEVEEKSILIVEPNPYHFEILPGYVKYFQDIGYKVVLIAQPEIESDSPFILYDNKPEIYLLSVKNQKKALQSLVVKKYDYVFLSSSVIWADNLRDSYINWLGFEPNGKNGFMMVEHNVVPYLKEYKHDKYVRQNKLFTLGGQCNIPMLNPHYFGNLIITKKSAKNCFVVIVNEKDNINLLFDSVRALLVQNIVNFEVIIAGRTVVDNIPNELKNWIIKTGMTSFKELWSIYSKCDFILPMLNPKIKNHNRYNEGTITGTWQSMMGFVKPLIIHADFVYTYQLSTENAIIYTENADLVDTMKKCIEMNEIEYQSIQTNIQKLANNIYNQSLSNLKEVINNP